MKKYGICEFSMIPVRSGESSRNEMVSQLLYGELFQVLKQKKKWTKIKLELAIEKIFEAEKQLKSSSVNKKELIIKNLLINLCLEANSF